MKIYVVKFADYNESGYKWEYTIKYYANKADAEAAAKEYNDAPTVFKRATITEAELIG